ncbi:MAG: YesL family protein [Lachnospiraceae bacterium]|nr:YesL family protein [Lachnospiraceae bacterium]MBO7599543.1 YesL family protein [Lachnospiraceae bacterium]
MGKIFDLDSPLMRFLGRVADLLWLNLLTFICCIPIITCGAAFTALHYSCLKLVRGEETYVTKDFFKSFKINFKQATVIWLICLVFGAIFVFDIYYMYFSGLVASPNIVFATLIWIAAVLYLCTVAFVFPLQSHFYNPIKTTIKNSFLMSMTVLPKTILIIVLWFVPLVIWYFLEPAALLCWLFWFSAPAYIAALLYNKTFRKYEPEEVSENDDFTWSVNSDLVDEDGNPIEDVDNKTITKDDDGDEKSDDNDLDKDDPDRSSDSGDHEGGGDV